MKALSEIVINVDKDTLTLSQSRKSFVKNILYFCFLCLFILGGLSLFYFFLNDRINIWTYIVSASIIVLLYFLLNKKRLRSAIIKLRINGNFLIINDQIKFDVTCNKKMILYEFTGETLINTEGNLFLNLNNCEYPLAYGVTLNTIDQIHKAIDLFFGEPILLEKGKIY